MQTPDDIADILTDALKVNEKNNTLPSLQVIVQELFTGFKGVKNFAMEMIKCYQDAKPGSQVKARLAAEMIDLVKIAHDRGVLGVQSADAESLDDDELEQEIKRASERALKSVMEAKREDQ